MNQIMKQKIEYKFVPEVAKIDFESSMDYWYDSATEQGNGVPFLKDGMFFEEGVARDRLLDFYTDAFEYYYAANINRDLRFQFDPKKFPVHLVGSYHDRFERSREYFEKHEDHIELLFFEDMRKMLLYNRMFFQENYSFRAVNPTYQNVPFGRVW